MRTIRRAVGSRKRSPAAAADRASTGRPTAALRRRPVRTTPAMPRGEFSSTRGRPLPPPALGWHHGWLPFCCCNHQLQQQQKKQQHGRAHTRGPLPATRHARAREDDEELLYACASECSENLLTGGGPSPGGGGPSPGGGAPSPGGGAPSRGGGAPIRPPPWAPPAMKRAVATRSRIATALRHFPGRNDRISTGRLTARQLDDSSPIKRGPGWQG